MRRRRFIQAASVAGVVSLGFAAGVAIRRYQTAGDDLGVGDHGVVPATISHFAFADVEGRHRDSSEWRGRYLLLNFWATWCAPCREEIPLLVAMQSEFAARGLQVVGVALDFAEPTRRFGDDLGINYPSLVAGRDQGFTMLERYQPKALLPFSLLADPTLRIVSRKLGAYDAAELRALLEQQLSA